MKPVSTTLFHRVLPPGNPGLSEHPTLILLHGRGANEEDLIGLLPVLDSRLLVLSVRAPFPFSSGYTWYDIGTIGAPEPAMFKDAYDMLSRFVDDALAGYPIDREKVFLFGFSMGAVMSFALSLTRPDLFRGVVAHSGYVPEETHLVYRWQNLTERQFFIAHGIHDPVIAVDFARRAEQLFKGSDAHCTVREYPIAHQISDESIGDIAHWLDRLL
jgi:phospholipase/carboxylesterase